jgi:feruloyl esterase
MPFMFIARGGGMSAAAATPAASAPCEALSALTLPNAHVTGAAVVAAGAFRAPDAEGRNPAAGPFASVPAFCRVTATLKPSSDSDIKVEVWLPVDGWNGKFQAVGNGGWAGVIPYTSLAGAVAGGYASAGTDAGHAGNTAAFAPGHPEKVVDMGYRAVHEMTVHAKAIIAACTATRRSSP